MDNTELTQVFDKIHTDYFSQNTKVIIAEFYPYRSLRHTIEWDKKSVKIKVSKYFNDAPIEIIKILAIILLAKIYRIKVDRKFKQTYQIYIDELQKIIPKPKRRIPENYIPQGKYYDLSAIFDSLNKVYFSNKLNVTHLGWSKNKSYTRLGFYDKERKLLVISKIFDSHKVPFQIIEFLVYHEMLHILIAAKIINGRRKVHPPYFSDLERKFPNFSKIDNWIKSKRYKL